MAREESLSVKLQSRDWDVLHGLFESRVMTRKHIAALYFGGKAEMAKKRLQRLMAAKLIRERPRRHISEPSVLFLTRPAFRLLHNYGKLTDYPRIGIKQLEKRVRVSELKLRHELEVMDVKSTFVPTVNATEKYRVEEFSTWPTLYQFQSCDPSGQEVTTQPDAFIRIHEKLPDGGLIEHTFYLEVDRSKEDHPILTDRAHCYHIYYRDGGLAVRNGRPREEYKQFNFRVLVVCKTADRRNNLASKLLWNDPPVHTQVWLTTMAEVTIDPLGAIWIRPVDYRDVTRGTAFDPYIQSNGQMYRRSIERENFVGSAITQHQLLS